MKEIVFLLILIIVFFNSYICFVSIYPLRSVCTLYNECTKNIIYKNIINRTIIAIVASLHYVDEAVNFYISSLKKLDIHNYLYVTIDDISYTQLSKYTTHIAFYKFYNISNDTTDFGSKNFNKISMIKTYILLYLLNLKIDVFISDVDVHFFKNPLKYFCVYTTDLVSSTDSKNEMNTGLLYNSSKIF